MQNSNQKYIYIVVSKTNTLLGRLIRRNLGVNYNHCSVSLDDSLENIYSFGRKELWNVFRAGFVRESKSCGFFEKHGDSFISVMQIPVTDEQWQHARHIIMKFKKEPNIYKYSILGLIYCYCGIPIKRKNKYFCSQFVAELLQNSGINLFQKPESLVRPHDFLSLSDGRIIYTGTIGSYGLS